MRTITDTTTRTSLTPWEKRGARYRRRSINNMSVYFWCSMMGLNLKVLDVGCGKGDGMLLLSLPAKELHGIDFSLQEIKFAVMQKFYCPTKIYQMNLEKEWFPEDVQYDLVTCFETLEHLANPEFVLQNIAKSCKKFIFSVPHNAPSKFHKLVYKTFDEVKALVEPYFNVEWWFERKRVIRQEPFKVPFRYMGIATPK